MTGQQRDAGVKMYMKLNRNRCTGKCLFSFKIHQNHFRLITVTTSMIFWVGESTELVRKLQIYHSVKSAPKCILTQNTSKIFWGVDTSSSPDSTSLGGDTSSPASMVLRLQRARPRAQSWRFGVVPPLRFS